MKNKTQYNKFYKDYAEKTEALEEGNRGKLYGNLPNLSGKTHGKYVEKYKDEIVAYISGGVTVQENT